MHLDIVENIHNSFFPAAYRMLALGNLVACGYQCGDGALDNIFVNADAPVGSAVADQSYEGCCLGRRTLGNRMFFVISKFVVNSEVNLDGIAYRIQTAVTGGFDNTFLLVLLDGNFRMDTVRLLEPAERNIKTGFLVT